MRISKKADMWGLTALLALGCTGAVGSNSGRGDPAPADSSGPTTPGSNVAVGGAASAGMASRGGSSAASSGGGSTGLGPSGGGAGGMPNVIGGMPNVIGGMPNVIGGMPNVIGGMPNVIGGMPNVIGGGSSGSTSAGGSGSAQNPLCAAAQLTEHVTFENPEDGRNGLSPFTAEVAGANRIAVASAGPAAVQGALAGQVEWHESSYAGTRVTRGVEGHGQRVVGEVWMSYLMFVPSKGFPTNKRQMIGQFIAWHRDCETDKTIVVSLNDETLSASSWFGSTPKNNYYVNGTDNGRHVLSAKLPRDAWLRVVVHAKTSSKGSGLFEGWLLTLDGSELGSFSQRNINLGTGCFEPNGEMTYGVYPKVGLYAHDTAAYETGEVRTLYFDDVRVLHGNPPCAFETVAR